MISFAIHLDRDPPSLDRDDPNRDHDCGPNLDHDFDPNLDRIFGGNLRKRGLAHDVVRPDHALRLESHHRIADRHDHRGIDGNHLADVRCHEFDLPVD